MTTDHKVIGVQYLVVILFLLFGGIGAMFIRTSCSSRRRSWQPTSHLTLVGLHSVMMIFMASAAIIGPFGNYFVPDMIGTNMAFPRLEALTFWLVPPAAHLAGHRLLGGFPTGWTGYAPLVGAGVTGLDSYLVGFTLIGLSIVCPASTC